VNAPHRVSPGYEAIDLALVAVFLGALSVLAMSARQGLAALARRRQKRRAWLLDFEARDRDEGGQ
jgi:O-antigen ligase